MTRSGREVRVVRYPNGAVTPEDFEVAGVPVVAVSKNLTLRGFRGSSNLHLMAEMQDRLGGWLRSGDLVHRETVFAGLDQAPHALAAMIAGATTGKTLVSIG